MTAAAAVAPLLTTSTAFADVPSTGAVLFEDDFTGTANTTPDTNVWEEYSTCTYDSTAAFGGIDCGVDSVLDGAGHLSIPAAAPTSTDPDGQGSAVRTKTFDFQYGTMSAWMKMPAAPGSWPAFWSLNNDRAGGQATTSAPVGEVDAVEAYTTWDNVSHALGHTWTDSSTTEYHSPDNRCPAAENADLDGQYNKFSAKIEPGRVTFYFNDVACGVEYLKDNNKAWGFAPDVTRGNWLILQHAVGGAAGQNTATGPLGAVLVDRVEVRALNTAIVNNTVYTLKNQCGGTLLDVPGASTTPATSLTTWQANGGTNQQWRAVDVGGGYWKLLNQNSGQAMNVNNQQLDDGARIIQYWDFGGANQEWQISDTGGGYFQLISRHSGKALNVEAANPNNGAAVEQWTPNTSCAQRWQIVAV